MRSVPQREVVEDRISVVTGASAGIGVEIARGLAARGGRVIITGRNAERLARVQEEIRTSTGNDAIEVERCDFSSLAEVKALGERLQRLPHLDLLVNNAGVWHQERVVSADGFENTFAVNHLAHFTLTLALLDRLRAGGARGARLARIVTVASSTHAIPKRLDFDDLSATQRYKGFLVYSRSKLANVLFANELAHRLEGEPIVSNSLHPGDVQTSIVRDSKILSYLIPYARPFIKTAVDGAETPLWVACAPELEGLSGRYFSHMRERPCAPAARDREAATRLWNLSVAMCGLEGGPATLH